MSSTSSADANLAYARPLRSSVVLMGDSRIASEMSGTSTQTLGAFAWANTALLQRFTVLNVAGIIGNKTSDLLARYAADVEAFVPGIVVLGVGVNDVSGAVPIETIKANLLQMVTRNRAMGARTVLLTVAPNNVHDASQKLALSQLNRWIITLGGYGDVFPADVASPVVSNTGMTWDAPCTTDGLHQSKVGAARQGKVLARVLENLAPENDPLPLYNADPSNWVTNSFMDGALGAAAAGYQAFPVESSPVLVARTDQRPGRWYEFNAVTQVSNTLATGSAPAALPAGVIPGTTKVYAVAEMSSDAWASAATSGVNLSLQFDAGGAVTDYIIAMSASAGDSAAPFPLANQLGIGDAVVLQTRTVTVPAGSTRWRLIASATMQGKIRWSRFGVYAA